MHAYDKTQSYDTLTTLNLLTFIFLSVKREDAKKTHLLFLLGLFGVKEITASSISILTEMSNIPRVSWENSLMPYCRMEEDAISLTSSLRRNNCLRDIEFIHNAM